MKRPQRFNAQPLKLIGVAEVENDHFVLYEDAKAALNTDLSKAIFIRQVDQRSDFNDLNGHWVEVTGSLDAERYGPLGAGFPCELLLQKARITAERALVRLPIIVEGRFRNDTAQRIHVKLLNDHGGLYAEFEMEPTSQDSIGVRNGRAIVTTQSGRTITSGKIILSVAPRLSPTGRRPIQHFRITDNRVERVSGSKPQQ